MTPSTSCCLRLRLLCVVLATAQLVSADLPIHCIHANVVGKWKFEVTANAHDSSELCGYQHPDLSAEHFSDYNYNFIEDHQFEVKLVPPNIVEDVNTKQPLGTWTMVYDEGFEMQIHGSKYFAFFHYTPNTGTTLKSEEVSDYTSHCDQLRIGWYHAGGSNGYGCYKGVRSDGGGGGGGGEGGNTAELQTNQIHHQNIVSRMPTHDDENLFEPDYAFVEMVNRDMNSKWHAKVHEQFLGKDMGHMHKLLGRNKYRKPVSFAELGERVMTKAVKATAEQKAAADDLPDEFDWRDVKGVDYVTEVKNQGSCGSCYAVAAMSVFEARIRIKSKMKMTPDLSAQDVLACSAYNQGCEGGYPFLVAKYGAEYGFTTEKCLPYTGDDSTQCAANTCRGDEDSDDVFFTENYHYIGGYYGGCNGESMRKEIYDKGPVIVAFEAPGDLFYYSGGVFHGSSPRSEAQVPSTNALLQLEGEQYVNKWEQTNHAVLAVGWGVDTDADSTPYWIIKNTWGKDWGENGYFRIKRGADECGVESMAVAADVILPGEKASDDEDDDDAFLQETSTVRRSSSSTVHNRLAEMFQNSGLTRNY